MIEIISYEANEKEGSTLKGFFTIYIKEWKLTIARMCYFCKDESTWVAMPSYTIKAPDDNSKWLFYPVIKFDAERQEKFLAACKKSLMEFKQKPITKDDKNEEEELPF